ncbi:E3 ubiquitin-protein ligase [Rhizina undulata]
MAMPVPWPGAARACMFRLGNVEPEEADTLMQLLWESGLTGADTVDSTSILQKFLKCSICLETLVNPMSLRCTHIICWECLVQTFTAAGRLINCRCPICRAPSQPAKRNPSIACLMDDFQAINGVKVPEGSFKEPYGDLDVAELFAVENDHKKSILVEDVLMGGEEL